MQWSPCFSYMILIADNLPIHNLSEDLAVADIHHGTSAWCHCDVGQEMPYGMTETVQAERERRKL